MEEDLDARTNQDQADDINDKLLLDLAWERQQKKTFTAWCNSHLRKSGLHLDEIDKGFRDGLLLLRLLEIISGDKVAPAEKGKMRIHKITNVKKCLEFISQKGVKLIGIGPEEIVDGNLKMTLGMIWTIILRFAIQDISVEEMSAKEGLLLWCQRKTAPYKNVNVQNFHVSFKDGLAFCALIHRHRPDLLDYSALRKSDDLHNLNLAFELAEKHLDIPKMLDAEDIHSTVKPDERAIMTYVSSYYHAFASNQQAETAAKRIGKVLTVNQENEKMMEDYEQMASNLLEWIQQTLPWLNERTPEKTLSDTKDRMEEFRQYSVSTKPPKAEEKGKLESHFHTLQTKLRLSNRPAYVPSEGKLVSDITSAWKTLEAAEKSYQEFLEKELDRLRRLELLAQKFEHKANALEQLFAGKDAQLQYNDDIAEASLADANALRKIHETFETDLEAQEKRVAKLGDISCDLENLEYHNTQAIKSRLESIQQSCQNLKELSDDRRRRIDEAVARQEHLDNLRLEFAKIASALNNWIENCADDLHVDSSCSSIEEAETNKSEFETFKSQELHEKSTEYERICRLVEEIGQLGSIENPYTKLSPEDINQKWQSFVDLVGEHTNALDSECERQIEHENFRKVFAEKANKVGEYIEAKSAELADLSMSVGAGTMEEQLEAIKAFLADVVASQADFDEAETAHQDVQAALIFTNPYTTYTIEALRSSWSQLIGSINRAINETENQILIRDSKGLSEEQLKEYRSSFNHFDRDNSGMLDKNEYRSCLLSLGYNLGSDPNNDPVFEDLWTTVDPNETGHVTFESFVDFMTRETVDQDTSEQVLASFKILAGDKPYITADLLRKELPPDQAEYCISRMAPYTGPDAVEGALDYSSFSSALYGQSEL